MWKSLLLRGSRFLKKKHHFFRFEIPRYNRQANRKKNLFCHWKNTSKLWRTSSLSLPAQNFLSHLHFIKVGEIMLLKYGNLMLPARQISDLYCVRVSNAAPFCENYTKLCFNAKKFKKGLNRGEGRKRGKIFGALFSKKVSFLANVERRPRFLEYGLTRSISR